MRMKTGFRKGAGFFAVMMLAAILFPAGHAFAAERLLDTGDKLVVVIDPGHGGDNLGTQENGHLEKAMTLTTAQAMYDRLSLYDGVEVYMTRTGDESLSLKERAEFAESVGADFLFSVHYNASENHELFGSEVWVSVSPPFNGYGYQFGRELLEDFKEYGLFIRGVKSRLGDQGNYYGIIREAEALKIPAVIIEHCHVDEARDEGYCDSQEDLKTFGRMDADAVAKYFGLKSSALGIDASGAQLAEADLSSVAPLSDRDSTAPEICQISQEETDGAESRRAVTVTAADYDTCLLYYSYSLDGGSTYSQREPWPECDALTGKYPDTFTLNLDIPAGTGAELIVRAYNKYDLYTESNVLTITPQEDEQALEAMAPVEPESAESGEPEDSGVKILELERLSEREQQQPEESNEQAVSVRFRDFLLVCLALAVFLFLILLTSQVITAVRGKKRRRR